MFNMSDSDIQSNSEIQLSETSDFNDILLMSFSFSVTGGVIAFFGCLGNSIAFWVWLGDTSANSATYLFLSLAFWDNVVLLSMVANTCMIIWVWVAPQPKIFALIFIFVTVGRSLGMLVSLHVTAMIAVQRFVAVIRPLQVHSLLTKRRLKAVHACVVVYSMLVLGLIISFVIMEIGNATILLGVAISLPVLVLVFFTAGLLWVTYRSKRPRTHDSIRRRRMTSAVICIATCSLLTYPVNFIVHYFINYGVAISFLVGDILYMYRERDISILLWLTNVILVIINSSINVFFYLCLASKFVELAKQRLCGSRRCQRQLTRRRPDDGAPRNGIVLQTMPYSTVPNSETCDLTLENCTMKDTSASVNSTEKVTKAN